MSKDTVHLAVNLAIHDGKLADFEEIARIMIAGTQNEPGTLGYDFFFSHDRRSCRLVESYVNADAVLAHFKGAVVQELVPRLLGTSSLTGFEVYGNPGAEVTQMIDGFGAHIFQFWGGVSR